MFGKPEMILHIIFTQKNNQNSIKNRTIQSYDFEKITRQKSLR